jgi:hypothetical protein
MEQVTKIARTLRNVQFGVNNDNSSPPRPTTSDYTLGLSSRVLPQQPTSTVTATAKTHVDPLGPFGPPDPRFVYCSSSISCHKYFTSTPSSELPVRSELEMFLVFVADKYLLPETVVGIPGVHQVCEMPDHSCIMQGSNFAGLVTHPLVDYRTCTTNDLRQCFDVLGIEATREMFVREVVSVFRAGGSDLVDLRHIMLLADTMTMNGTLKSVTRHGIDRNDVGPLAKASFEQMLDNFMQAAYRCEKDPLTGVSGAIMTGKCETFGSSTTHLYMSPAQQKAMTLSSTPSAHVSETAGRDHSPPRSKMEFFTLSGLASMVTERIQQDHRLN